IIFKSLITIHTLMRLGNGEKVISYVETQPSALDTSKLREKSSGVVHIQNIYLYTAYLEQKVIAYRQLRYDYVKNTIGTKESRLRHLPVNGGLLKETVILQKQIGTLLKCNFILDDVDNNISIYAFRLLVEDLLVLFQVMNESIVNILEHYFTMEKPDARTSLEIYKRFARQTQDTTSFLERARKLQHELRIAVPSVKHASAPLSLAAALQEYLDQDKNSKPPVEPPVNIVYALPPPPPQQPLSDPFAPLTDPQPRPKELVDFFASLENETVNIFYNPIVQQQPMLPPPTPVTGHNPFRTESMSIIPQPSLSSTYGNSNPFRANTMPQASNSTPLTYFGDTAGFTQVNNNNPFTSSNNMMVISPSIVPSHNPFSNHTTKQPWG
ncbi:hypothetical protein CU098_003378, partial [Rhizopus stolonifer]